MEITDQEIICLKIISCSCKKNFSSPPPSLKWHNKHYLEIISLKNFYVILQKEF